MRQSKYLSMIWFSITGLVTICIAIGFSILLSQDYSLSSVNYYCMATGAISGAFIGLVIQYIRKKKNFSSVSIVKQLFIGFSFTLLAYLVDCLFITAFFSNKFDLFLPAFFSILPIVPFIVIAHYGGWIAFIMGPLSYMLYIRKAK